MAYPTNATVNGDHYGAVRRVSWGAIFAGTVVALAVQLGLGLLGMSIGLATYDPASEADTLSGMGIGAGIWLVISTLISIFVGGFIASRLAGSPARPDGILQGIVVWALATLLTFFLMTTAVGGLISGAAGVLGKGLDLTGQGIAAVAPEAADQMEQMLRAEGVSLEQIKQEALTLLRQSGKQELQPKNIRQRAGQAGQTARGTAQDTAQTPADAEAELQSALDRLLRLGKETASVADREAVVNILVARTDMGRAEAERTVDQYIRQLEQAKQVAAEFKQEAIQAAETAANATATAAFWGFIALVLGAIVAAIGGAAGIPKDVVASTATRG